MKKTLALVLCLLMIICSLPLAVTAADDSEVLTGEVLAASGYVIGANKKYRIESGSTITIPESKTLYLDAGSSLDVYGTLKISGYAVSRGGTLTVKAESENELGVLIGTDHISGDPAVSCTAVPNPGHFCAEVIVKALPDYLYNTSSSDTYGRYIRSAQYCFSWTGSFYDDIKVDSTEAEYAQYKWQDIWAYRMGASDYTGFTASRVDCGSDVKLTVPLNQYFYVKTDMRGIERPEGDSVYRSIKKYNNGLMQYKFNDVECERAQGRNSVLITTAGVLDFVKTNAGDTDAAEKYFINNYPVYIPTGTGYHVYGIDGEISGAAETVRLTHGKEFRFRVRIDSEFSESDFRVYAVNRYEFDSERYDLENSIEQKASVNASYMDWNNADDSIESATGEVHDSDTYTVVQFTDDPSTGFWYDQDGIFYIDSKYITREFSIVVLGVAKNDSVTLAGKILQMIRSFFESIKEAFNRFIETFKIK